MKEKIIEEITEVYCEIYNLSKHSKTSLKNHLKLFPEDYLKRQLKGIKKAKKMSIE